MNPHRTNDPAIRATHIAERELRLGEPEEYCSYAAWRKAWEQAARELAAEIPAKRKP